MTLCWLLCTLGHDLASSGLATETANGNGGKKCPQAKQSNKRGKDRKVWSFQLGHHSFCSGQSPPSSSSHTIICPTQCLTCWDCGRSRCGRHAISLQVPRTGLTILCPPLPALSYPCPPTLKCCSNLKSRFAPSLLSSVLVFLCPGLGQADFKGRFDQSSLCRADTDAGL